MPEGEIPSLTSRDGERKTHHRSTQYIRGRRQRCDRDHRLTLQSFTERLQLPRRAHDPEVRILIRHAFDRRSLRLGGRPELLGQSPELELQEDVPQLLVVGGAELQMLQVELDGEVLHDCDEPS